MNKKFLLEILNKNMVKIFIIVYYFNADNYSYKP